VNRAPLLLLVVLLALLLGACGGPKLNSVPPSGFNLQGEWELVRDLSELGAEGDDYIRMRSGNRQELARGGMARDFPVVRADAMRIEQNRDSMGISYSTGDYRDISWGRRDRGMWQINAGWIDDELHIISEAHDAKGTEVMSLSPDGKILRVFVEIDAGQKVALDRVYRRADSSF
jgi:hypothetical protein